MKLAVMMGCLVLPAGLWMSCSSDSSDDDSAESPAPVVTAGPDTSSQGLPGFALDDFKACSPEFASSIGTYWYAFSDTNDGGASTSTLELGAPLADGGPCSLKWSGKVTTDYQYGYAGMGLDLGSTSLANAKSLVFKVRGDGAAYRVKLPMNQQITSQEFNFHGADMACGDGSANWKTVTIDLASLQQEQGWGTAVKLDLADVGKIQIQTKGQPIPAFTCEIAAVGLVQ